jgi:hypothetical protein
MAVHNAVADDEIFPNWYHYLHLQWSWRYSGRILSGGNTTTIIFLVDFMVREVFDIAAVTLVKSAFSPAELGWWAILQQQYTFIHFGFILKCIDNTMIELFPIIVFGEGQRSSSFSHPCRHWNYFLRLFYSIENAVVIPVNLKIGYESTVLSHGETR